MLRFGRSALFRDQRQLLGRFWQSTLQIWREQKARAIVLTAFLIAVAFLQLFLQVLLNLWNRNFFDALGRHDAHGVWIQVQLFVPLAATSIFLAAISVWGRMTTQRSWREALTRHVIEKWLHNDRYLRLNHLIKGTENPEYRIAVDVRVATDAPVDMVLAIFTSVLTSITFFGVLWTVGGNVDVILFGMKITIPGYLVFGVVIYSGTVSALMVLFGHHLTSVIERTNQAEAEFRAAIDAFHAATEHENASSGDARREALLLKLQSVLLWWREYCSQLVHTTFVSHGNFLFAPVIAWILCVPKYLSGVMSLGELTQSAAAFVVVQGAFNWLVDNYQRISDWRSSAHRVATLLLALDELEVKEELGSQAPQ